MSRNIFLTGGTGFVGSSFAHHLLLGGDRVIFLLRPIEGPEPWEPVVFPQKVIDPKFDLDQYPYEIVLGDIRAPKLGIDPEVFQSLKGRIDMIFHTAGSISFSEEEKEMIWQTNVEGTRRTLEFAQMVDAKHFHHISTAYVVGDATGTFFEEKAPRPDMCYNNTYEHSKAVAETVIWNQREVPFSIYRPSIVVGANDGMSLSFSGYYRYHAAFWSLANRVRQEILSGSKYYINSSQVKLTEDEKLILPIMIKRRDNVTVNLVPIDWLAKTIVRLSYKSLNIGEIFHIVHSDSPTVEWLIETSLDILGITGVQFVNPNIDPKHDDKLLDRLQRVINPTIKDYNPYATQQHLFLARMTKAILNSEYEPPPPIDRKYLERILGYAVKHNFKREKEWTKK